MPASVPQNNPTATLSGSHSTDVPCSAEVVRSRTPPDLKWLVNERASVHGAIRVQEVRLQVLDAKKLKLMQQLERVDQRRQGVEVTAERLKANLQALDISIALVHQEVDPSCAGSVRAWAGRYGERGALTAFVRTTLQARAPNELPMPILMDLAARHFGQTFQFPRERRSFRQSVRSALRALHVKGLIEPLHEVHGADPGIWRWKAPVSSLEALQQQGKAQGLSWR